MSTRLEDLFRQSQNEALGRLLTMPKLIAPPVRREIDPALRGPLGQVMSYMSAGLYGVANVADALLRGDTRLAEAFWRGLTLQERKTFTSILEAGGAPAAGLVGFVLDVGLDPMTYLGGLPFKALSSAWQVAKRTKTAEQLMQTLREFTLETAVGRQLAEHVSTVGRAFSTTWGKPREYVELRNTIIRSFTEAQRQVWEEVQNLTRRFSQDELKLMVEARTKPWVLNQLRPEAQQKALEIYRHLDELAVRGVREGLWTPEVAKEWINRYIPIRYPERLGSLTIYVGGRPTRPPFARERVFRTVEEARLYSEDIAKLARSPDTKSAYALAEELDKKWGGSFFRENVASRTDIRDIRDWARYAANLHKPIDDIARALAVYETEWAQYYAQKTFTVAALRRFGRPVTEGVTPGPFEDVFPVPEWLQKAVGHDKWILPKEIAKEMNDLSRFFMGSDETLRLLRVFDKWTGRWRSITTVWRLPFHIRNLYSNWFNMWLAGVDPADLPSLSTEAAKILGADSELAQRIMRFRPTDIVPGLNRTYKQALEDLKRLGIVQTGFISSEVHSIRDFYAFIRGETASWTQNQILRAALDMPQKIGRAVENSSRVALWLDGMRKGLDELAATRRTFKYLFDYQDITPFERNVLRRFVPFYTWLRKNIPLQIEMMLQQPEKYLKTARAFHAIDAETGLRQDELESYPDWIQNNMFWVKFGTDKKGRSILAFLDIPAADLQRLLSLHTSPEQFFWQLHPIVDAILTLANVEVFPKAAPIERFPGDMEPAPWVALLPAFAREWLGAEPIVDRQTGRMVLGVRKKRLELLRTAVPPLEQTLTTLAGMFGNAKAFVDPADAPWIVASYLSGVRFEPHDVGEERMWRQLERKQRLAWAASLMRLKGRALTREELEDLLR